MMQAFLLAVLLVAAAPSYGGVPGNCPRWWPLDIRVLGDAQAGGESTRAEVSIEGNHVAGPHSQFVVEIWTTEYIPGFRVADSVPQVWQILEATTLWNAGDGPFVVAQACFYYRQHHIFQTRNKLQRFIRRHFDREAEE